MNAVSPVDERIRAMLPVYLLNVGADHKQEPRNRPNGAGFYQFLYVARGEGVVESGTLSLTVKEGTTVFSTKDVPIAYRAKAGEFRTGWVAFDGARVREILDYLGAEDIAFLHSDAVRAQMLEIYKRTARNASAEILSCNVYELIVTFFGELNEGKKPPHLLRAKAYMEAHYARDLSVSDVAEAVGISESFLYRLFRTEERTTPVDYLRTVRIRRAKEALIGESQMRISDVAGAVGFSDVAYFCKIFKSETGMTPRTYRTRYAL